MNQNRKKEIIQFDPMSVQVDFDYALKAVKNLDVTAEKENRLPIEGNSAIRILGEYGAIAYRCSWVPQNVKLAIVICPPFFWLCPSKNGLNGIFIEEYEENYHGKGISIEKGKELFSYTNIDGRLDGWSFCTQMMFGQKEIDADDRTVQQSKD